MEGNYPFSKIYDLRELGVQACLPKPIIYNDLRAAIRENLGIRDASVLAPADTIQLMGTNLPKAKTS